MAAPGAAVSIDTDLTMSTLPLFSHERPDSIIAYRDGLPIDA
jgi:hypothetical protein